MIETLTSRRNLLYFWLPILVMLGAAGGYLFNSRFCSSTINKRVGSELGLYLTMRELWTDHVVWTRNYIIDAIGESPSTQKVAARLLKNQEDIGHALAQFYGNATGQAVTDLLKEHILIAVDLITAAKLDNTDEYKQLDKKWHDNADQIAKALSDLNPNWPYDVVQKMLYEHLALTTDEVVAQLKKDDAKDIAAFDKVIKEIWNMADVLTKGILQQFPAKF